ncbi:hypothetical protein L1987_09587 [Smallanthus sonchifolius]|uniref:Uncharacterized protein n=1 Tax=Smallanthus sonchifolius TaxID=185202 RepID=A0ACB9JP66_9ASTR|nr:hypothetical protein L1987_09587 [Smallanthus sonchifolius]
MVKKAKAIKSRSSTMKKKDPKTLATLRKWRQMLFNVEVNTIWASLNRMGEERLEREIRALKSSKDGKKILLVNTSAVPVQQGSLSTIDQYKINLQKMKQVEMLVNSYDEDEKRFFRSAFIDRVTAARQDESSASLQRSKIIERGVD